MSKKQPDGPPGRISPGVTCRCGHTLNQHSKNGCIYADRIGNTWRECKCKVTYNQLR
jgi:hypothetical protein